MIKFNIASAKNYKSCRKVVQKIVYYDTSVRGTRLTHACESTPERSEGADTKRTWNVSWTNCVTKWGNSMNSLYTYSYRCRDFAGSSVLSIILSASAFNSCMIELSIPDFNETIIKNIISLLLSFSNTERREVVFCTQWFIGQYCSEPGERVPLSLYISRTRRDWESVPLSLYFISILWRCIPQTPK